MKRVLVIDDHVYVRETLVALLSNERDLAVVGSGADGVAAVELVEQLEPDVLVMDVQMPGTDGVEATRRIVRRHGQTRVVILTAAPYGRLALRALDAGAHALLAKSGRYSALVDGEARDFGATPRSAGPSGARAARTSAAAPAPRSAPASSTTLANGGSSCM